VLGEVAVILAQTIKAAARGGGKGLIRVGSKRGGEKMEHETIEEAAHKNQLLGGD